ncbi:MAG: hypothetical protein ABJF04_02145 [Reichenbachiella sp.]|uniref:tetratricopeptide repeat protein n=1 Tax=Reichenbachiella sp. TaxID=2184521 RepID=UPI0032651132
MKRFAYLHLLFLTLTIGFAHVVAGQNDTTRFNELRQLLPDVIESNIDSADWYLEEMLALAGSIADDKYLASAYEWHGNLYFAKSSYDTATYYYDLAKNLYLQQGEEIIALEIDTHLAALDFDKSDYEKAITRLETVLSALDGNDDNYSIKAKACNILGNIYSEMERYETSNTYLLESAEYFSLAADSVNVSLSYITLAYNHIELKNYEQSLAYAEKGYQMSKAMNFVRLVGASVYIMGKVALQLDRLEQAEAQLTEALDLARQSEDPILVAYIHAELARLYMQLGQSEPFATHIDQLESLATDYGLTILLKDAYELKSAWHEKSGTYDEALKTYKVYKTLADSLFNERMTAQINEMTTKYNTEKKEREIEQLKHQEKISNLTKLLMVAAMVALVIIGALIYSRQQKAKQLAQYKLEKAQQEIEYQEQELMTFTLSLAQKKNLLHDIKESAKPVRQLEDANLQLKKINSSIKNGWNVEKDWEEFRSRFEKIHDTFFSQLIKLGPTLTPYDLRMCAYLKLSLSSKEIAALLNIKVSSVEIQRSRLRKKLNLTQDENLGTFILKVS